MNMLLFLSHNYSLCSLSTLQKFVWRLKCLNIWNKLTSLHRKFLNLLLKLMRKGLVKDGVRSLKVKMLLGTIFDQAVKTAPELLFGSANMVEVAVQAGRSKIGEMLRTSTYRWAYTTLKGWLARTDYCYTCGLSVLGFLT